jgi:hypothetical protein
MKYILLILMVYGMQAIRVANDFPKINNDKEFDYQPMQIYPDWLSENRCFTFPIETVESNSEKCSFTAS